MPPSDARRDLSFVLFGASGFTGGLTAHYLMRQATEAARRGESWRWAIAGRNSEKLDAVLQDLRRSLSPGQGEEGLPEIIVASVDDGRSLREMAARTRVLGTTVGPFADYGRPVVAACVAEGTQYADITGEPEFVAGLLDRLDAEARAARVRLVSCCGFDSVPHDLGAWLTVQRLPDDRPIRVEGVVRASGTFSGGTWHSAVHAMAKARKTVGALRKGLDAGAGRRVGSTGPKARYEQRLGAWIAPLPTIDPWIVSEVGLSASRIRTGFPLRPLRPGEEPPTAGARCRFCGWRFTLGSAATDAGSPAQSARPW